MCACTLEWVEFNRKGIWQSPTKLGKYSFGVRPSKAAKLKMLHAQPHCPGRAFVGRERCNGRIPVQSEEDVERVAEANRTVQWRRGLPLQL